MHFIPENLRFLRKQKGWTQSDFARQMGVNRSVVGAYEEGRADPRISFLQQLCLKFNLSLDQLVNQPLDIVSLNTKTDVKGANLRILPITVDVNSGNETASIVPVKAAAGYLNGFGDVEFIESLSTFPLPFPEISRNKTYRIFQISGESMLPIFSGSYIISSYLQDWNEIKNDECYIVVSKTDGIVFKRIISSLSKGFLTLKSDNSEFEPYKLDSSNILELWRAEAVTQFSFDLPQNAAENAILKEIRELKEEFKKLNKHT